MKKAFTLAETLITLTILGVIATITIPQLKTNVQEKVTVAKVSNTFKLLEDSYRLARMRYGDMKKWGLETAVCNKSDPNARYCDSTSNPSSYIAMQKLLGDVVDEYGSLRTPFSYLSGESRGTQTYYFRLKNGAWVGSLWVENPRCTTNFGVIKNYCGDFTVDINGADGPNRVGRDKFVFIATKDHIIPLGAKGFDTVRPVKTHCNMKSTASYNGYGCTAWVIYKKNMDYLRKEVDWDKDD